MIRIKCYGPLREVVAEAALRADAPLSVRQVLRRLWRRYPALGLFDEAGKFASHIVVLVAGRNIWSLDGLETIIAQRETVVLVHPIEGG